MRLTLAGAAEEAGAAAEAAAAATEEVTRTAAVALTAAWEMGERQDVGDGAGREGLGAEPVARKAHAVAAQYV